MWRCGGVVEGRGGGIGEVKWKCLCSFPPGVGIKSPLSWGVHKYSKSGPHELVG